MAMSHVELYEALKGSGITEDAARLIADVVPPARDLASRSDVIALDAKIDRMEARLEAKMQVLHASTLRWMIGLFLPAWAATAGTLLTLVVKS